MMKTIPKAHQTGIRRAVIDLGSNSIKCSIAEIRAGELRYLAELSSVTALGADLESQGSIGEKAVERAFAALREIKKKCTELRVDEIICVGAEALRRASNAADFMDRIRKEYGWETRVLSAEDEAGLGFQASAKLIPEGKNALVLDSGGGSTEFSFGDADGLQSWSSLPLGALTLTKVFIQSDPVSPDELKRLKSRIRNLLQEAFARPKQVFAIACGGTATNLASVALALDGFESHKIHGFSLSSEEIKRQIELFSRLNIAQRAQIRGLQPGREEVILAGALILREIAHHFGIESFCVSTRGIRHALLSQEK